MWENNEEHRVIYYLIYPTNESENKMNLYLNSLFRLRKGLSTDEVDLTDFYIITVQKFQIS